jgi:pimeloyl-ACP methyl ester carboxylesterase
LGIDRLGVWGWSGGGSYALAAAAILPDLVEAAALLGSCAPWDAPGLDFFAGMGQDNIDDTKLYFSDPSAARKKSMQDRDDVLDTTTDQLVETLASLLSATDAAVLTGEFAEWLLRAEQDGLAQETKDGGMTERRFCSAVSDSPTRISPTASGGATGRPSKQPRRGCDRLRRRPVVPDHEAWSQPFPHGAV